eukprot:TRINITY_DN8063_c0_g1_i1.p1 TRINITY_DN8063_c0_g1~~TRINITY_DN8063_c0_g1_i1.p1  ORF type:complete len:294 (+),score=26.41 TRINITY_DN8063_c0_g1_i1:44-883(+)
MMSKLVGDRYLLTKELGRGTYGEVREGFDKKQKLKVAVKIVDLGVISKEALREEMKIMEGLKHANVMQYYDITFTKERAYVVLELAEGGDLQKEIAAKSRLSPETARKYFKQVLRAVGYCHDKKIVHRDLKPENILLSGDKKSVLVADFGLSKVSAISRGLSTFCGTTEYLPPEVLKRGFNNFDTFYSGYRVDVWSCGVILHFMLVGARPWTAPDPLSLMQEIMSKPYSSTEIQDKQAASLISIMLNPNPEKRHKIKEIKKHPWVTGEAPKDEDSCVIS